MPRRHVLLANRLERLARSLPAIAAGAPDAVHDARVATRRLRELLPLLDLPADQCDELRRGLRSATRRLGRVRELDVQLELIARFAGSFAPGSPACAHLAAAARSERAQVLERACAPRVRRNMAALVEALGVLQRDLAATAGARDAAGWRRTIADRAGNRATTATALLAAAGTAYAPEPLHALRVALKKLRYALELAAEATGQPASRDLRELVLAQDELGDLHDLQLLAARAHAARDDDAVGEAVADELAEIVATLELRCRELHGRFVRRLPRLAALLARYASPAARRTRRRARAGR